MLVAGALPGSAQFPDAPRDALPPLPERRAAILKEFDADKDGRLTGAERDAARKAYATKLLSQRGDRGFFGPPPELMEEFDKNKDGELDETEGRNAMETMGRRMQEMQKEYDKNTNGRLDPDEIAAAMKAVDDGKLKGIPKMFIQFAGGPPRGPRGPRGGPGGPRGPGGPGGPGGPPGGGGGVGGEDLPEPGELLEKADVDGDGRLSSAELEKARAALAERKAKREKQGPPGAVPGAPPAK